MFNLSLSLSLSFSLSLSLSLPPSLSLSLPPSLYLSFSTSLYLSFSLSLSSLIVLSLCAKTRFRLATESQTEASQRRKERSHQMLDLFLRNRSKPQTDTITLSQQQRQGISLRLQRELITQTPPSSLRMPPAGIPPPTLITVAIRVTLTPPIVTKTLSHILHRQLVPLTLSHRTLLATARLAPAVHQGFTLHLRAHSLPLLAITATPLSSPRPPNPTIPP